MHPQLSKRCCLKGKHFPNLNEAIASSCVRGACLDGWHTHKILDYCAEQSDFVVLRNAFAPVSDLATLSGAFPPRRAKFGINEGRA